MSTVAFVPARGGSRGIVQKNIRPFCGRPLLYWCLRSLEATANVDRIIVATDSEDIAAVARGFGLSKVEIYRRSEESATNEAGTEAVMLEYLAHESLPDDTVFMLVQATSPFTEARDFERALDMYDSSGADSMLSCVRNKRFFWDETGWPINYDPRSRPRRQEFTGCFMENGAFYISRVGQVLMQSNRLSGWVIPYEMPAFTGLELDEEDDWVIGEVLMRRHAIDVRASDRAIRLVLTDVDGVLTDGGMYYSESGDELKKFNTLDGKAFELLREQGVLTGIVTGEQTRLVAARAAKIGADFVHQGIRDKLSVVRDLCAREGIALEQVAFVGDDLGDLEVLRAVGFSACPSTAVRQIKDVVHHVCQRGGGQGCLREVVDRLFPGQSNEAPEVETDAGHLATSSS